MEIGLLVSEALPDVVKLTRDCDIYLPLSVRGRRSVGSAFVVSLHTNAFMNDTAHGSCLFYRARSPLAKSIAQTIGAAMPRALHMRSPVIEAVDDPAQPWLKRVRNVLTVHDAPSVLLEWGFLTNEADRQAMLQVEVKHAVRDAIVNGILFGLSSMEKK